MDVTKNMALKMAKKLLTQPYIEKLEKSKVHGSMKLFHIRKETTTGQVIDLLQRVIEDLRR